MNELSVILALTSSGWILRSLLLTSSLTSADSCYHYCTGNSRYECEPDLVGIVTFYRENVVIISVM